MWFVDQIVEWLATARDWLNDAYLEVKEWLFPFYYLSTPLYGLYRAFYYLTYYFGRFNEWLDWAAGRISEILSFDNIAQYFKSWFDAAQNAWLWVTNAVKNIYSIAECWWSDRKYDVKSWIDEAGNYAASVLTGVTSLLNNLQAAWDAFKAKIPTIDGIIAWWSGWQGNVLTAVNIWWLGATREVQKMIESAFVERDKFWEGWQDFKDKTVELFTDPVEFVWSRFTDWFLGPEV